jgi:hypothetical protein
MNGIHTLYRIYIQVGDILAEANDKGRGYKEALQKALGIIKDLDSFKSKKQCERRAIVSLRRTLRVVRALAIQSVTGDLQSQEALQLSLDELGSVN